MNLSREIKSDTWIKNWSGNWRLPFVSLYQVYLVEVDADKGAVRVLKRKNNK